MRRTLALVALLATTWPHVAVMGCAATPRASHGHMASVAAGHAHDGPDCPAIMPCSSAMIEGTVDDGVAEPAPHPALHPSTPTTPPSTTDPTSEPPPPRRLA